MNKAQTWLITGAGSGFGLELTRQLLASGNRVAATTRRGSDELDALHQQYPGQLCIFKLDMTELDAIEPTVKAVYAHFGSIDVLISNAGYMLFGALEELSPQQINQQIQTNLHAPIILIRAVLPYMREQGYGTVVQIASEAGQITFPALSMYHATKWGIDGFCESVAREVAALNIRVIIVEPGRAATNIDKNTEMSQHMLPAYQQTTVGLYRKLAHMGRFPIVNDPVKIAARIIEAAQSADPPLRLALGKDAYKNISAALKERLQEMEKQKDIAYSTHIGEQ